MSDALALLMHQFLAWIAETPRSYTATMEAWRTSCPRLPVWEDATLQHLVQLERDSDGQTIVTLTAQGRAVLAGPAIARPQGGALQKLTKTV